MSHTAYATDATSPAPAAPAADSPVHLTPSRVLRSEWIKFWSLRSSYWTLGITAVVFVGVVALMTWAMRSTIGDGTTAAEVSVIPFTVGMNIAMIPLLVLGALTITGEYATGQIRSSLTAVPARLPVLVGKAIVLSVVVLAVTTAVVAAGLGAFSAVASGSSLSLDLSDPEIRRILGGTVLYLSTIMLFSYAVGALLRHSAAALAVVLGLLLLVEQIVQVVGFVWKPMQAIGPFLPGSAGSRLTTTQSGIDSLNAANAYDIHLSAWQGYGILVAWVVVVMVAAAVRLRTKDA
jgi:ABC-2 type transport system permease protein